MSDERRQAGSLSPPDETVVDGVIRAFAEACRKNPSEEIAQHLLEEPNRLPALVGMAEVAIELAWKHNPPINAQGDFGANRAWVEYYLRQFPELCERHSAVRELIAMERSCRPEADTSRDHYLARFPEYRTEVEELFSSVAEESRPSVNGYKLLEVLGRGGMGIVYKALQFGLNREVALKMVLGGHRADQRDLNRFLAEVETVAAIQHPYVVQVHEFGDADGQPFLAMEYLPGGTLADFLANVWHQPAGGSASQLTPMAAAELVVKVARGVAAAHALGIVHRDLKPGNVLFDESGEPKVADFGLAKRGTGGDLTASQAVLGTPHYMAPEQARGETKFVGLTADVYALGAILYECLTGQPPFTARLSPELVRQVLEEEPTPPRQLQPATPKDLQTICLKCLEKDPNNRYRSALELAEDLSRFQSGDLIAARPKNVIGRLGHLLRRNRFDLRFRSSVHVLLFTMAATLGLSHVLVFLVRQTGSPPWHGWVVHGLGWVPMAFMLLPRAVAAKSERDQQFLWLIVANFVGCCVVDWVVYEMAGRPWPFDEFVLYPHWAIVNALCLFAGGNLHGVFYVFSISFFLLAVAMSFTVPWAPLEYGIVWTSIMFGLGLYFRRLGGQSDMTP